MVQNVANDIYPIEYQILMILGTQKQIQFVYKKFLGFLKILILILKSVLPVTKHPGIMILGTQN